MPIWTLFHKRNLESVNIKNGNQNIIRSDEKQWARIQFKMLIPIDVMYQLNCAQFRFDKQQQKKKRLR